MPGGRSLVLSLEELTVMQEIPTQSCAMSPQCQCHLLASIQMCTWTDSHTHLEHMEAACRYHTFLRNRSNKEASPLPLPYWPPELVTKLRTCSPGLFLLHLPFSFLPFLRCQNPWHLAGRCLRVISSERHLLVQPCNCHSRVCQKL